MTPCVVAPAGTLPPVNDPGRSTDPQPPAIETLLVRAAEGDQAAWAEIIRSYAHRVFALLHAQCRDADLAEEIAQSTFCTVAHKIGAYTEQGRFEQWLFRIAMNRLRDEMRRRKRQAVAMEEETLVGLATPRPAAGGPALDPEDLARLERALTRLNENDREVVHLRHICGLSFKQIALVLDEPLGTVLARQHRAMRKLHDLIEADRATAGGPGDAAAQGPASGDAPGTATGGTQEGRRRRGRGTADPSRIDDVRPDAAIGSPRDGRGSPAGGAEDRP